jgi:phosphoglucomutase
VVLTGNQMGALLVYYLLCQLKEQGKLPANGAIIKTIVTSELGAVIAESFGVDVVNTLTGFKYIGEQITRFERTGERTFLFGYEESYGFLAGTYARDKDAVIASLLICEAAAYYKRQGIKLYQLLLQLYEKFGTYLEGLESRTYKGLEGEERISAIMADWRLHPPAEVAGVRVDTVLDYVNGLDGLRAENVLKYVLADGSWFCLRPSGTEPKIKVYFSVRGQTQDEASRLLSKMQKDVMARADNMRFK